ncbi:MAG TPA: AraC family transcriptional regulator, partial [Terriglobales bacterium]|nr:AraC family transcriptional regulator [Terriglobales bacterium]
NAELSGRLVRQRTSGMLRILEHHYPAGLFLPVHTHENAYMTVVMYGDYAESCAGEEENCGPGAIRFLPAGESHADRYVAATRCLHVEIPRAILERLRELGFAVIGTVGTPSLSDLGRKLYREFLEENAESSLVIEGLVLEMLGQSARSNGNGNGAEVPDWLLTSREILESDFRSKIKLTTVATQVGVHPVHLCREFRRHFNCTVGEYLRKKRIEYACEELKKETLSIKQIGINSGFWDQTHFTSTFKRLVGTTPKKYRSAALQ